MRMVLTADPWVDGKSSIEISKSAGKWMRGQNVHHLDSGDAGFSRGSLRFILEIRAVCACQGYFCNIHCLRERQDCVKGCVST